jgi:alginate O-acetyltransferase complex protein AlgI
MIAKAKNVKSKKIILIISLIGNLGLLGFFKYADFAITQFNFLGQEMNLNTQIPLLHLVLPIAISFYTFHSITYTVSIYRGQMQPVKSFTEYAIFVAFFPQLVAGPILRAKEFLPQLREKLNDVELGIKLRQIKIENVNLKLGLTIMAFGFLKKIFFADNIAPLVNDIFVNPINLDSFSVILATIAFAIQIYCDFSGYSDIALGAAVIMGFKIPINFNKPYFATSPSDFWKRWHISLSSWLRDYLYIPLGGNRKSKTRTYLNLMVTMFLGGLWHGASWNFVIWGLMHGAYLAIHKTILDRCPSLQNHKFFSTKIGKVTSILVMQYLVFLAWIPFRVNDIDHAIYAMQKYIILDLQTMQVTNFVLTHRFPILFLTFFIVIHFISFKTNILERIQNLQYRYWTLMMMIIIMAILLFYDGNPEDFIYFKF